MHSQPRFQEAFRALICVFVAHLCFATCRQTAFAQTTSAQTTSAQNASENASENASNLAPANTPPDFITNFSGIAKNTIFVELGGSAVLYSLNYDRLITPNWSVRAGISYLRFGFNNLDDGVATTLRADALLVPITSSYIINFPSSPHHIELGGGVAVVFGSAFNDVSNRGYSSIDGAFPLVTGIAAYRLQQPESGFFLRAGLMPFVFFTPIASIPVPWIGLSFGGSF